MGVAVLEMSNGSEYKTGFESLSRFAPCKGIRNPWKFCLWNPESEQICTCTIWNPGHWNPEYKFRWQQIRNQVPENRNPWHRIQKPRLSWIPSHGRRLIKPKKVAVSTEWKVATVRYHMCVTSLSRPYLLASDSTLSIYPGLHTSYSYKEFVCGDKWEWELLWSNSILHSAVPVLVLTFARAWFLHSLQRKRSSAPKFLKNTKQIIGFTAQYELASHWDIWNITSNTWLHLGCAPKNLSKVITAKGCQHIINVNIVAAASLNKFLLHWRLHFTSFELRCEAILSFHRLHTMIG